MSGNAAQLRLTWISYSVPTIPGIRRLCPARICSHTAISRPPAQRTVLWILPIYEFDAVVVELGCGGRDTWCWSPIDLNSAGNPNGRLIRICPVLCLKRDFVRSCAKRNEMQPSKSHYAYVYIYKSGKLPVSYYIICDSRDDLWQRTFLSLWKQEIGFDTMIQRKSGRRSGWLRRTLLNCLN